MSYQIFDSDGNPIDGEQYDTIDEALRAAGELVCVTWPNWERATISFISVAMNETCTVDLVTVERAGPKGTTRVRIALVEAGWVAWTSGDR